MHAEGSPRPPHVVLCGPSGAGKSTVGPLVARALGRPFVDIDAVVETTSGQSIPALFARGEALFRAHERRAVQTAFGSAEPSVIALGGGSLLDDETLDAALREQLVYLAAPLDTLVHRTARGDRPLLRGADRRAAVAALIDVRRGGYERAHVRVDAVAGAATVARRVLEALAVAP